MVAKAPPRASVKDDFGGGITGDEFAKSIFFGDEGRGVGRARSGDPVIGEIG